MLTSIQSCFTFPRTLNANKSFDDEPKLPPIGNLSNHMKTKHLDKMTSDPLPEGSSYTKDSGLTPGSRICMEQFVADGVQNPKPVPSQTGFYKVFAAWAIDDDQPWTAGETKSIARLFKYCEVNWLLPSDTTVRNYVAKIFIELQDKVTVELSVIFISYFCSPNDTCHRKLSHEYLL